MIWPCFNICLSKNDPFLIKSFALFSAEITVIESCVETYNALTRQISYPQTNNAIIALNKCTWRITIPDDRNVILDIIDLQIDVSRNCEQSSLTIFDGPNNGSARIGEKLCGFKTRSIIESSGNELYLVFSSNTPQIDGDQFTIKCSISGKSD